MTKTAKKQGLAPFAVTVLVYSATFFAVAFLNNHFIQDGFGRSDLWLLLLWGSPGILLSSFVINLAARKLPDLREPVSLIVRLFIALVCTAVCTVLYPLYLGVWFGALSISPFSPNLAGALCASVVAPVLFSNRSKWPRAIVISVIIVLVCAIGIPLSAMFLKKRVFKGGRILTASITHTTPGEQPDVQKIIRMYCPDYQFDQADWDMPIAPPLGGYLLEYPCLTSRLKTLVSFHQMLKHLPAAPILTVSNRLAQYEETAAAVLFVFNSELHLPKEGLEFNVLEQTSVIYYQTATGWEMFPKDAKVSSRKIKMTHDFQETGEDEVTPILCLSVEDIGGRFDGPECTNVLPDGVKLTVE